MDIDKLISDKEFWTTTKVCVKVLLPAVKVLRFSDGMRGGNLGLMYNLLLQLDESSSLRCHHGLVYRCTRFLQTGGQLSTLPL